MKTKLRNVFSGLLSVVLSVLFSGVHAESLFLPHVISGSDDARDVYFETVINIHNTKDVALHGVDIQGGILSRNYEHVSVVAAGERVLTDPHSFSGGWTINAKQSVTITLKIPGELKSGYIRIGRYDSHGRRVHVTDDVVVSAFYRMYDQTDDSILDVVTVPAVVGGEQERHKTLLVPVNLLDNQEFGVAFILEPGLFMGQVDKGLRPDIFVPSDPRFS